MKLSNFNIYDLLKRKEKFSFLVGAGCSIPEPSCLPSGYDMTKFIANFICVREEKENIFKLINSRKLRFEALIEILRDTIDNKLKLFNFFELCDKPNIQHFFLVNMMKKGHFVMTTNFDFLIELAMLKSNIKKKKIQIIITKKDFNQYSDPNESFNQNIIPFYKIHGSTKNIITNENTHNSLIATIQSLGKNKQSLNLFQIEPFKRDLFDNIFNNRTLIVMGYSGSDDFDIIPTLRDCDNLKKIIWLNHVPYSDHTHQSFEIDSNTTYNPKYNDRINELLTQFKEIREDTTIYRIDINTTSFIKNLMIPEVQIEKDNFKILFNNWLKNEIKTPNLTEKYLMTFKILFLFGNINYAVKFGEEMKHIIKKERNLKLKAFALYELGFINTYRKNHLEALKIFKSAYSIYNNLEDFEGKARILYEIGVTLSFLGKNKKALEIYNKAFKLVKTKHNYLKIKGQLLHDMGMIYGSKRNYGKALLYLRKALVIFEKRGDMIERAVTLGNLANTYLNIKNYDKAEENIKLSISLNKKLAQMKSLGLDYQILAGLYRVHYKDGLMTKKYMEKSIKILKKYGDFLDYVGAINNMLFILIEEEDLMEADEYIVEAGKILIDNPVKDAMTEKMWAVLKENILLYYKKLLNRENLSYEELAEILEKILK